MAESNAVRILLRSGFLLTLSLLSFSCAAAAADGQEFPSSADISEAVYAGVAEGISSGASEDPLLDELSKQKEVPSSQPSTSKKFIIKYKVSVGVWPVIIEKDVTVEIYVEDGKVIIRTQIGDDPPTTEELKPGDDGKPTAEEIDKLRKALDELHKDKSQDGGSIGAVGRDGAKQKIKDDIRRRLKEWVDGKTPRAKTP